MHLPFESITAAPGFTLDSVDVSSTDRTSIYVEGAWPGGPNGVHNVVDLMTCVVELDDPTQEHTFDWVPTQPWPAAGLSRLELFFDAENAAGTVLQSWAMPRAAWSGVGGRSLPADDPYFDVFTFVPPADTARLRFLSRMWTDEGWTAPTEVVWAADRWELTVPDPTAAPPLMQWPRDDELGIGGVARIHPAPTTQQGSNRLTGNL